MSGRLTAGKFAIYSLRAHKKQYRALTAGIALAIFFMSLMLALGQSVYFTYRENHWRQVGKHDVTLFDSEAVTRQSLLEGGYVSAAGSAYVIGEEADTGVAIGYYDEPGEQLAYWQVVEGRMPQSAGEIAVERAKLRRLKRDAQPGDRLTLKIKVPSGGGAFLPGTVEKTYVLAGVLGDQSIHREGFMWRAERGGEYYAKNLSAVVSRQERIEAGGRPAVHRLVALAPGVSPEAFLDYAFESLPFSGADLRPYSVFAGSDAPLMLAIIAVLGVVLVLAACMGIVAAFSATLSERRAQIGMLRAVGATRRQIRGLFGREAAFIALTTAPAAVAAAHGAAWALARALGGALTYQVAAWALPAELAFSLLCVAGAAAIPLLGASRVSPMQAIRETSLLRAKKRMRIKPRAAFWPPRLLAGRHLRMYRARQSGVAALVALSMVLLSLGVWMLLVTGIYLQDYDYDFEMYSYATERDAFVELDAFQPAFTDGDLREAAALPLVSDVQVDRRVRVNLMLDRVSEYVVGADWSAAYDYLKDDPTDGLRLRYLDLRKWLGTDKQLVSAPLIACSEAAIERLKSYVLAGEIDVEALNAGREVLIVAPDEIYTYTRRDEAGDEIEFGVGYRPDQLRRYDTVLTNDLFFAGGTLDLCRLYSEGAQRLVADADDYNYAAIRRVDRTVTIGAVLDGDATLPAGTLYWGELPLVTTLPGLSALGMETGGYRNMSVALGEQPDEATEEYLETRLTDMANRLDNAGFSSSIRAARDNRRTRDMLAACFAAVLTLFFALCVGMVNNAVTNRIRADRRSIGTLRAVGAPLQAIAQSYRLQVAMMLAWGAAAGAALSAGGLFWIDWYGGPMPVGLIPSAAGLNAALLTLIALCCGANLRARIRGVVRSSIVDNIREL